MVIISVLLRKGGTLRSQSSLPDCISRLDAALRGGAPLRAEEGRGLRPPAEARLSAWCSVPNVVPKWTLCPVFLCQCPVQSLQDVVKGLFVCCVFLDYVSLSQRFIPELINFLVGILYMATPNKQSQGELIRGSVFKYIIL